MNLDFSLNISQQQKLVMTQTMKQSINILQMSAQDLREYIDKEYEENPVLDVEFEVTDREESYENKINYEDLCDYGLYNSYPLSSFEYSSNDSSIFDFIKEKKSLRDYLYEQLIEIKCSKKIKEAVVYMIDNLDENGYLKEPLNCTCEVLGITKQDEESSLKILHSLEPYGVWARNLSECLIIQLRNKGILDDILEEIVSKYLEYIAKNKYIYIAKKMKISAKKVQEYSDVIKSLEPKPTRGYYTGDEVKFIIPDAYIVKIYDEYEVIMNSCIIPKLNVNSLYKEFVIRDNSKEEVEYIKNKINKAKSLIKGVEQRNNTLLKLLKCIIKRQRDYFENGDKYLKPMTLKDIANEMNVHESTVSRTINEKYILTDRGTIKIKDLFSSKILSKNVIDEDISISRIKMKIKEVIEAENKNKPLSDQAICNILSDANIDISRRTIAKYREELGIKSSSKRKRL